MVDSSDFICRLPRRRAAPALCAGLCACLTAGPALAQGVTIDAVARSVSLMHQILATCADFDVDADLASRAEKAFMQVGAKLYGRKAFAAAVADELPRRAQEARTTGSDRWCADQRARLKDVPGEKIFRN